MERIEQKLKQLESDDNLRELRTSSVMAHGRVFYDGVEYLNMSSNDYLGLGGDVALQREFLESLLSHSAERTLMTNSGSRLMSGNSEEYERLEGLLGALYDDRSALVLGSGYAVNIGVLPAITTKNDLILADRGVHASLIDGLRLCDARWRRFRHNDMEHLESELRAAREGGVTGDIWVVTESIFSMDGDCAPLAELVELKSKWGFKLYLDEAHAFGVRGVRGGGLAEELGLASQVDIIVATLGKAMASVGGFVVVDRPLRELLINTLRPLIFSTALPPINLAWSAFLVEQLDQFSPQREHLNKLVARFEGLYSTHIIPLMAYENSRALELAELFRQAGFWTTAIRHPTVPVGQARLRVSLSAAMQSGDIDKFIELWRAIG